jgi:hypothetical protein
MNAELLRNVWIELAPRRVILMVAILGLAFFAATLPGGLEYGPSTVANVLYHVIVVIWGTRNAATSVVGEIRDRTWDAQRLSSIGPGAMTIGKLFGSTLYNWLGGAMCLAVMLVGIAVHQGIVTAFLDAAYYVALGIISQAAALLASLIAVARRQPHSRLEIFLYQVVGLAAAVVVNRIWSAADPVSALVAQTAVVSRIEWWSQAIDARVFLLLSLAVFSAWTLVGCYREMRKELAIRNGPFVWLAFLAFVGLYVAGFDRWLPNDGPMRGWDPTSLRLALALTTYLILTYVMVLLEPKDRVQLRQLADQFGTGRLARAFLSLPCWMMSYGAALGLSVVLIGWLGHFGDRGAEQAVIAASIGFLARDISIFVLSQKIAGSRRGDFAALAILLALYVLLPAIVLGLHLTAAQILFFPRPGVPLWSGPVVAWVEALLAVGLAYGTGRTARATAVTA